MERAPGARTRGPPLGPTAASVPVSAPRAPAALSLFPLPKTRAPGPAAFVAVPKSRYPELELMEQLLRTELRTATLRAFGSPGAGYISQGHAYDTDAGPVFVKVNHKTQV